jgi:hypothetical protein
MGWLNQKETKYVYENKKIVNVCVYKKNRYR